MRLTKLEMLGFKSFADQTVMRFDDGVTAIVGPNGCGKSNVSDAVRWVLGEQRARILRGAKMEEVIFQGSSARRAVNVAEVSLVFENDSGALPVPFREVVVTRRLSRSGESEYLLNGASCRLRDIHDLMRGTGLGADCGVVIEQRMIDALLSDRPDDRRELFEEAAGVGLYRDRRRSSERRLEETAQDLARLDDLINEVQSQVRSLARQRRRAERHAELTTRRFAVELTLASRDMHTWREELSALETQVADLREAGPSLEQRVGDAERARDDMHNRRTAAETLRNGLAQRVSAIRERMQVVRGEVALTEERHRHAVEQRSRAEAEHRSSNAAETRLQTERARATSECAELQDALHVAQRELADRAAAESNARGDVARAREGVEEMEHAARALRDRMQKLEIDRESAERELQELTARARTVDTEREEIAMAAEALGQALLVATKERDQTSGGVEVANTLLERARAEARFARDQDATVRTDLGRTEDHFTALEGRVHGLEGLERERVGLAPAAARLLRERDRFGADAILGPLSDFVNATASSAALVERYLGMSVHAVLIRDRDVAEAVREWHASTNPGPLLLLPLDSVPDTAWTGDGDLLSGIDAAPEANGWVHVLLERVRALQDGAFVDARGAIWLPGSSAGPGPLRRRAELFALRADLAGAGELRAAAMKAAEEARAALMAAESAVSGRTDALASAVDAHRHAVEALAELERRKGRCDRELVDAHSLTARLTNRTDDLVVRRAELDADHADVRDRLREHDEQVTAARRHLEATELRADAAREQRTHAQVAVAQSEARLQVALDREQRIDEDRVSASQRLLNLERELVGLDELDRGLAAQMEVSNRDLQACGVTLAEAETQLTAAEHGVRQADDDFSAADHALDAARRHAQDCATELHHAELRYTELSGRRAAIRERLEAEWKRSLDDLLNSFAPIDMDDDTLRAEAEALRQQLEGLGPVNPLAIEEHDEEIRRLDFLTLQRTDLHEAKNALQQAIREIDTTVRELFLTTFTQVRENFRLIFMTLFGGGECDLRLENPDAPLDCDIEIHASPRGKRTQRIHLLSSGERALVALSLLFGIFLTKPSPFCLLDEVDAPLDDANIGRFVRMLNEFKQKTQFIVITHNPRTTTEAADGVYGITMQEPGVSSVVSVRMRGSPVDDALLDDMPSPENGTASAPATIAEEVAVTL